MRGAGSARFSIKDCGFKGVGVGPERLNLTYGLVVGLGDYRLWHFAAREAVQLSGLTVSDH